MPPRRLPTLLAVLGICLLGLWTWNKFYRQRPLPERVARLAPRGTFFLTEYTALRTPQGVIGFEPGQEVRFVSATDRTLTVTDGKYQVELLPRQLTNDLDIAALVRFRDEASQRQLAHHQAAELAAYQRSMQAFNEGHSARVDAFNRSRREASTVGQQTGLNQPAEATRGTAGGPSFYSTYTGSPYYYLRSPYYGSPYGY